jgi:hypothetical protein
MAARSEMAAHHSVDREKSLGLGGRLEAPHSPLALSCGLMRIFRPVIQPVSAFVFGSGKYTGKRGGVAAKPVRDHRMRNSVRTLQQALEEPFRGGPVTSCLYQDVNDLTVLIDCSPQVVSPGSIRLRSGSRALSEMSSQEEYSVPSVISGASSSVTSEHIRKLHAPSIGSISTSTAVLTHANELTATRH